MAVWDYIIQSNNFKLDSYPPLTITSVDETFDDIPFNIDIYYSFYSTLFQTTNTYRVIMSGSIYKYKNNIVGGTPNYPSVTLHLGGSAGGENRCGLSIDIDNCSEVHDFVGYVIENGVQSELQAPNYGHVFNGEYTANAFIRVDFCTLPILFSDATQDEIDNEYAFRQTYPSVYNLPQDLCFNNLTPLQSSNNPLTQIYCKDHIINFKEGTEVVPEGKMFNIYNPWQHGTWDEYSDIRGPITDTPVAYRNIRGKLVDGKKFTMYKIGYLDGSLRMGVKYDVDAFYGLQYSEDGVTWHDTELFPYTYLYAPRTDELGTFNFGLTIGNDIIPIWDNEEDADDYLDGDKDISEASNWGSISNQYGERILNLTGEEEQLTEFGENFTRQFFTQCYLCTASVLQEISNDLFDYDVTTLSGLWEDIKKGLEMYGSNPMEVVQGVRYYPFDLSDIFSSVQSQNYIYFGAYQLQLSSGSALKIIFANGYKDMGTVRIKRTFNDWRDFEPYTKLSIYLPYIGRYTLDAARYYDKEVKIRYYIDIRTGMCCACLIANGVLLDWFDGQIGVEMPITLTDYSSYAQTQINTILRNSALGAGGVATTIGAGVKFGTNMLHAEESYDASHPQTAKIMNSMSGMSGPQATLAATGIATGVGAVAVGVGAGMKTAYELMKTGTSAYTGTKGSSSAMVNAFLPQYPTFMFEILEIDESPYLNELYGRPTNASGRLGDFSGYLEAEDIMLICPIATDNERQEIIDLVRSGIYI